MWETAKEREGLRKKKKKGGERPREWLCVCKRDISVTFCLAKSPIWLGNEEGWSDGGEEEEERGDC